ncbi:hypothetical protein niasHT_032216 [Heterodera trifolii]|uniref:DUF7027 domain-containing protein n=1 Tax=Heterodera trifolii TaxID=157864 RepID=A0ABD2HV11_9BILA
MDFDPDHEIRKCCFCRIPTGLKILGLAECVLATAVLALGLHLILIHCLETNNSVSRIEPQSNSREEMFHVKVEILEQQNAYAIEGFFFCFDLSLCSISVLSGLSSLLMSVGVGFRREQLLYPTVMLRVLLIIFVTVFGVSIGVVRPLPPADDNDWEEEEENRIHLLNSKKQKIGAEKRIEEPSIVLRLVFLMFIILLMSVVMFYTIFLVLQSIRFIKASKRLQRRRSSVYLIGQIDPSLMSIKRPSQCCQMC